MIGMVIALIALATILGIAANLTIRAVCPHLRDPHRGRTYSRNHHAAHRRPRGRHAAPRPIGAAA